MKPGNTVETPTPRDRMSSRRLWAKPRRPNLVAAYMDVRTVPTLPLSEEMKTMWPPPRSTMPSRAPAPRWRPSRAPSDPRDSCAAASHTAAAGRAGDAELSEHRDRRGEAVQERLAADRADLARREEPRRRRARELLGDGLGV